MPCRQCVYRGILLDMTVPQWIAGWLILLALLAGLGWLTERFWGDSDKWGLPATGECAELVTRDDGRPDLAAIECDGPGADFRVDRRVDNTTDASVCAGSAVATDVFVFDGDTSDDGDEAVFCLVALGSR